MSFLVVTSLFALLSAPAHSVDRDDACTKAIPQKIVAQLRVDYPQFRPVRASNYSQDSLAYPRAHGIQCPGTARADVDGNGLADVTLFITSNNGRTLLVVARQFKPQNWRTSTLYDFGTEGVSRSYVEPFKAGSYTDLFASDMAPSGYEPEPGRVKHYRSQLPGFMAGTIESTGAAFFFTGKKWVHLWLSD